MCVCGGGGGGGALFQVSNLVFYAQSTIAVISGRVSFSMKSRKLLVLGLFNAFATHTFRPCFINWEGQSHETVSTNHSLFEEEGDSKRYRTEVFLLTSLTPYRSAKPAHKSCF